MILILKGTYCLYDVNTSANSSFVCCSCVGVRTSWCETLPIYGTSSNGCSYSDAVRILLNPNKDRVCTKLPIYIEQNCSFVVDLKSLQDPDDLKSDDPTTQTKGKERTLATPPPLTNANCTVLQC